MDEIERQAEARWAELVGLLGVDAAHAWPVFEDLRRQYKEPHRHYHTLAHILDLLRKAEAMAGEMTDPRVVALASWFHDAVYDPHRQDNEAASADLAEEALRKLGVGEELIAHVREFVLATEKHVLPAQLHPDLGLFLDLDLSILGAEPERYHAYAAAIRKEYEWVPRDVYNSARRDVLRRFLALAQEGRLFHTEACRARYGAPAIDNLQGELPGLA